MIILKHIKRAKTSITTLQLGEETHHRVPVVAIYLRPVQGFVTTELDADASTIMIPGYQIHDIDPISEDPDNIMVNVSFHLVASLDGSETDQESEFMVTIPMHYIALAKSMSVVNEAMNIVVVDSSTHQMGSEEALEPQNLLAAINFPNESHPDADEINDKMTAIVNSKFAQPLFPMEQEPESQNAFFAIPAPKRRSQMAIMTLISALSQNDVFALGKVLAMENTLNNFHMRNHKLTEDPESSDYARVMDFSRDATDVDDMEENALPDVEYSLLDNMSDAIEEYLKEALPKVYGRSQYKDISLLALLTNVKYLYQKSESDDFLTVKPIVPQEHTEDTSVEVHREFMELSRNDLSDVFDNIDTADVEKSDIEKAWSVDLELWHKKASEYWPEDMSRIKEELDKLNGSEKYFAIMDRSYSSKEEWDALVSEFGLGKVFSAIIIKTAVNLCKFTGIANTGDEHEVPASFFAARWISDPDDPYVWEIPALAYALAEYDVSTFVSLMTYTDRDHHALYLTIGLHGLTTYLVKENWEKRDLEWSLSQYTGMPLQHQKLLLDLVEAANEVEIIPEELGEVRNDDSIHEYVSMKAVNEAIMGKGQNINDIATMVAYAIPALADIHVQSFHEEEFREEQYPEGGAGIHDTSVTDMGSLEWKKHRIAYIESMLDFMVKDVERRVA